MKTIYYSIVVAMIVTTVSCNRFQASNELAESENDEIALEVSSNYYLNKFTRSLDVEKDAEFIDEEVLALIRKGGAFISTKSESGLDTLFVSSEIPFYAEVKENTVIYADGEAEISEETLLNPETNPLLGWRESKINLDYYVAKTVIKGGYTRTYNSKGKLLSEIPTETYNYKELLEQIKEEKEKGNLSTKALQSKDINYLRSKVNELYKTKSLDETPYRIYEDADNNIIIEKHSMNTKSGKYTLERTKLSSDLNRQLGFEQYEGDRLVYRLLNIYNESPQFSTKSYKDDLSINSNLSLSVSESLVINDNHIPVIRVEEKEYIKNTVRYNF